MKVVHVAMNSKMASIPKTSSIAVDHASLIDEEVPAGCQSKEKFRNEKAHSSSVGLIIGDS